ncbi:MAG: MgtC/SapB family protein [Erysipelotrichaceae bacterium]|nr:MgtC/SapB family protein [Erysipelotrichaceae bacterium]MDD4642829.1 MgtC/SapB family protein [Erysipelotrichaceae bacterium]
MFDQLRNINIYSIIFRMILALLVGGILGIERGHKKRPAGFRTYMLVCLGATLVMMTNQYVYQTFNTSDPVRMGAQVVSGIGFLGAGAILITGRNQVKGITTAAGLWTAACSGLAIGIGFYEGALVGAIAIIFVMATLHNLDSYIHNHARVKDFYIEMDNTRPFSDFLKFARSHELNVTEIQMNVNKYQNSDYISAFLSISSNKNISRNEILGILESAPGLHYIEEI